MAGSKYCHVCRAMLTSNDESRSPGVCPYCGEETQSARDTSNPYAPPRAEPGVRAMDTVLVSNPETVDGIPPLLFGKLGFALKLFYGDFFLLSALVLTVWLPGNLITNLLILGPTAPSPESILRFLMLRLMINLALGPFYAAGILYVLANRMTGQRSTYVEAIQVGIHNWWRLFAARCITSFIIFAGIIAFIIPGIRFAIRFSLIDPVVVLEGAGISEARLRSTELVQGREMGIFAGSGLLLMMFLGIAVALQDLTKTDPMVSHYWIDTGLDCTGNLLNIILGCLLFTYFWEAHIQKPESFVAGLPIGKTSGFDNEH